MPNRNIILTLDTETADLSGNVYDLGYIIHDRAGNELGSLQCAGRRNFHTA